MGMLDDLKQKVSDHHANAEIDYQHNEGHDRHKSDTQNWVAKGQGGDRLDDHGHKGGSVTSDDTQPALSDPKVQEAIMNDKGRVGSTSQ